MKTVAGKGWNMSGMLIREGHQIKGYVYKNWIGDVRRLLERASNSSKNGKEVCRFRTRLEKTDRALIALAEACAEEGWEISPAVIAAIEVSRERLVKARAERRMG